MTDVNKRIVAGRLYRTVVCIVCRPTNKLKVRRLESATMPQARKVESRDSEPVKLFSTSLTHCPREKHHNYILDNEMESHTSVLALTA